MSFRYCIFGAKDTIREMVNNLWEVADRLGPFSSAYRAREVVYNVKVRTYTKTVEEPICFIPVRNGILDLRTRELLPHDCKKVFTRKR